MHHRTKFVRSAALSLCALFMVVATTVFAAGPQLINNQGILLDGSGNPITVATSVEFRIYDAAAAGTMLWNEVQIVTPDADGLYNVLLGAVTPIPNSVFNGDAYLTMEISPDAEMPQRQRLVSVPFTYKTRTVDGASGGVISSSVGIGSGHNISGINVFTSGENNTVTGPRAVVAGGVGNTASGDRSAVGGGTANTASGLWSTIGGGVNNTVTNDNTTVSGGSGNTASGIFATVGGGAGNNALTDHSTIAGGSSNSVSGIWATVGGGLSNTVTNHASVIAGGQSNSVAGWRAMIPGGFQNTANGDYSLAAGRRAKAMHSGAFVWGDQTDADFSSTAVNQFLIRAGGGVGIGTDSPATQLHVVKSTPGVGVIQADYTDPTPADAIAVKGTSIPADYWGIGGYFQGGYFGSQSWVLPTGPNVYYGAYGAASGGSGTNYGTYGYASGTGTNYGVYGTAGGGTNWAGYFSGNVNVTGTVSKGGGSFKIDHPLDPDNKFLYHSFVESPDMMNVYNGNVTTDASGEATVELPDYFDALNSDFRYQLTVIGQFAQAIVAEEIVGTHFVIKTDKPNVKVSWQVTGVRQDAFAKANRIPVEELKPTAERGLYLYPEALGKPVSKGIDYQHNKQLEAEMAAKRNANATSTGGQEK